MHQNIKENFYWPLDDAKMIKIMKRSIRDRRIMRNRGNWNGEIVEDSSWGKSLIAFFCIVL